MFVQKINDLHTKHRKELEDLHKLNASGILDEVEYNRSCGILEENYRRDKAVLIEKLHSTHNETVHPSMIDMELTFLAIKTYHGINGNTYIPRAFVVPSNDVNWPSETWDIPLGQKFSQIESNDAINDQFKDQLKELGIILGSFKKVSFEVIHQALKVYKELHGKVDIPIAFVVPSDAPVWPKELWGLKLGAKLVKIRLYGAFAQHRAELEELGVSFDTKKAKSVNLRLAIETYKNIHGNLQVPHKFVVPSDDPNWPEECWGLQLKRCLTNWGKTLGSNSQYREELEALGVSFDVARRKEKDFFDSTFLALTFYKVITGHLDVPRSFVVPRGDTNWPEDCWNVKLGENLHAICNNVVYNHC